MNDKQKLIAFMSELLALLDKHDARLTYTTDDDGVHVEVGHEMSPGFFDRDDLRAELRDLANSVNRNFAAEQSEMGCSLSQETQSAGSLRRFVLDGVLVDEIPCDQLPKTNMCNYCLLKGTACYSRRDVDCHSDSRPDGRDVVFRRVQNIKVTHGRAQP